MAEPIFYVDRSNILEGKLAEVRELTRELAAFVEAREPRLIAYRFYIDESESMMTVVAIHPDSASIELHMEVGGARFRALGEFIRLRSIDVYGQLDSAAMGLVRGKAEMLGGAIVTCHTLEAGFSRGGRGEDSV
ncbi:hypothetical protein [Streptomyces sp. NPDC001340]